jgi:hypothetical protein
VRPYAGATGAVSGRAISQQGLTCIVIDLQPSGDAARRPYSAAGNRA